MQTRKAFTLVEVMVTVAIIAILATLGVTNYSRAIRNGRDARRKSDISNVQQALVMYRYEIGQYPNTSGSNNYSGMINCLTGSTATMCGSVPTGGVHYLSEKIEPQISTFDYIYNGSTTTFTVCAKLELAANATHDGSGNACTAGASGCDYYCLHNP